jgi:hypothetical protein
MYCMHNMHAHQHMALFTKTGMTGSDAFIEIEKLHHGLDTSNLFPLFVANYLVSVHRSTYLTLLESWFMHKLRFPIKDFSCKNINMEE